MGNIEIHYAVRFVDTGEVAQKIDVISSANFDLYDESFSKSVAERREYSEYQTGRKLVVIAWRIVWPEVVESKNATSNRGVL